MKLQTVQTVTFSKEEIIDIAVAKAKENWGTILPVVATVLDVKLDERRQELNVQFIVNRETEKSDARSFIR